MLQNSIFGDRIVPLCLSFPFLVKIPHKIDNIACASIVYRIPHLCLITMDHNFCRYEKHLRLIQCDANTSCTPIAPATFTNDRNPPKAVNFSLQVSNGVESLIIADCDTPSALPCLTAFPAVFFIADATIWGYSLF
jgi:hypothetical protein